MGTSETNVTAFLELVNGRRGHFRLESGHHSGLWLDLDPLFAEPRRIRPLVDTLTSMLRPYNVAGVCGPLLGGAFLAQLIAHELEVEFCFTERCHFPSANAGDADDMKTPHAAGLYQARYRLPPAFVSHIRGKRMAVVDDVMSAGSALRGTYTELESHGAVPIVAGALLVLGSKGAEFFAQRDVAVEAVTQDEYELWLPADCPLCATGEPLEDVAAQGTTTEQRPAFVALPAR